MELRTSEAEGRVAAAELECSEIIDARTIALQKIKLKQKRIELIKQHGLPFYRPHAKQTAFHEAASFRYRALFAGNRTGKSWMGCAEDCAYLEGSRAWLGVDNPLRTLGIPQRPLKGLVITTDWDKVDEIFTSKNTGKLWKLLPNGFVKSATKNHSGVIDKVVCHNGATLFFDTVKAFATNPQGAESSDWDFIHVDEPCPEEMWKAHSRGLMDRGGPAWFTLTPLSEPWITDFFFPIRKTNQRSNEIFAADNRPLKWVLAAETRDNPYLTEQAIADYEATLTDDEKDCRLRGIPLYLSGCVYREFDFDKHVLKEIPKGWKDYNTPPSDYTLYYAIDPHPKTPHAVLFLAVSPSGARFYFEEISDHCKVAELSKKIVPIRDRFKVVAREICDPFAFIENPVDDNSMADEFHQCGVQVEKAIKDPYGAIIRVKGALKDEQIYFSPNLTQTLWEFKHYVWDTKKPNHVVDKHDHMMENLGRLEMQHPIWIEQTDAAGNTVEEEIITKADMALADVGIDDEWS